jgi:alkylhydroperoxidase family enzyme
MTSYDTSPAEVQKRYDDQIQKHGRITNMKRTMLHAPLVFDVYMYWYELAAKLEEFLPHRAVMLFSYAISAANRCLVCGTFFRKILIDNGDDPDEPDLNEEEELLMELGYSISENPHDIAEEIYGALKARYTNAQIVTLIGFAGQMAATNLFNTVAKVDLDEILYSYKSTKPQD